MSLLNCEGDNWKGLRYEHVDWNDIVEAELTGDTDALLLLRCVF